MDFRFSEDHEFFRQSIAAFVDKEIKPRAAQLDEAGVVPVDLFRRAGELGYLALRYPEEYGGINADTVTTAIFAEELARGSLSMAAIIAMQAVMGTDFVYRFGSKDIHERCLKPALRGEKFGTIAMTEPNAGSDLGGIQTTARRDGDSYVIHGQKTWITNATLADFVTVLATTDKSQGLKAVCWFFVEKGTPGFQVGKAIHKLGIRASETTEVMFDNCRIPVANRLGEEGKGVSYLQDILAEIRILTAALGIGLARAALEDGVRYARERVAFGKQIGTFQLIQEKLATMQMELEASRLLTYYAAWLRDHELPHLREANMAKLKASETAAMVADEVTRIFASYGFAMEYPAQRHFRDARFLLTGGGTSELLKVLIGRSVFEGVNR